MLLTLAAKTFTEGIQFCSRPLFLLSSLVRNRKKRLWRVYQQLFCLFGSPERPGFTDEDLQSFIQVSSDHRSSPDRAAVCFVPPGLAKKGGCSFLRYSSQHGNQKWRSLTLNVTRRCDSYPSDEILTFFFFCRQIRWHGRVCWVRAGDVGLSGSPRPWGNSDAPVPGFYGSEFKF